MTPDRALAVYGTLAPGEVNHHVLLGIDGSWIEGYVLGYQFEITWGAADGYPGVYLSTDGNRVPVHVLVSDDLDRHWSRIDQFEGPGYRRVSADVYAAGDDGDDVAVVGQASIFEALTDNDD